MCSGFSRQSHCQLLRLGTATELDTSKMRHRRHSNEYKASVDMVAISSRMRMLEIAADHTVYPCRNPLRRSKRMRMDSRHATAAGELLPGAYAPREPNGD